MNVVVVGMTYRMLSYDTLDAVLLEIVVRHVIVMGGVEQGLKRG